MNRFLQNEKGSYVTLKSFFFLLWSFLIDAGRFVKCSKNCKLGMMENLNWQSIEVLKAWVIKGEKVKFFSKLKSMDIHSKGVSHLKFVWAIHFISNQISKWKLWKISSIFFILLEFSIWILQALGGSFCQFKKRLIRF